MILIGKVYIVQNFNVQVLGLGKYNYCWNFDGDVKFWCYVLKNCRLIWEYCDVFFCFICGLRQYSQFQFCIKGGFFVDIVFYFWQVVIFVKYRRLLGEWFLCGGIFISFCWIFFVVYCFQERFLFYYLMVILGRIYWVVFGEEEQKFEVEKYIVYKEFDDDIYDNDIVLLQLKLDLFYCVQESSVVCIVCFFLVDLQLLDWIECEFFGYGKYEVLFFVYLEWLKEVYVRLYLFSCCIL